MAMKRTQLEKLRAVTILDRIRHSTSPGRFGQQSSQFANRKERREAEKAAGLVPFAVKLQGRLVERVRALANQRAGDINAVVGELLEAGLKDYPEIVEARVVAAPVAASPAPVLTLAQKMVAVALGKPGATVVERPVVKPVKPVKVKPQPKKPAAAPAPKAARKVTKKKAVPARKPSSIPIGKKPAAKKAPVRKAVAAKKPATPARKVVKAASKPARKAAKPAAKSAGKAKRKS
jgi:hypothetical protein